MKKLHLSLLSLAAMAMPAAANAAATINFVTANPVPTSNDFKANLAGLNLTRFTTTGASIVLNEASTITFEFLGSESGFSDTFTAAGGVNYTEHTTLTNNFGSPIALGTSTFAAGSLAGLLNFTSSGGASATVGQDGFGIFLAANQETGQALSTFYLGYDDQITNQDDNHDDMIIRATVHSAVPEPATWAMMLVGFGAAGYSLRRKRVTVMQAA